MKKWLNGGALFLFLISGNCAFSKLDTRPRNALQFTSEDMKINVDIILSGLGVIWGFDFLPDGRIILTEKSGSISTLDMALQQLHTVTGSPKSVDKGQGGLLDIAVHPEHSKNGWVYFTYVAKVGNGYTTELARATLLKRKLTNFEVLFSAKPAFQTSHHFGSRITFDRKGHLFLSVGDRGQRHLAQNLSTHNGKVIRLKNDGSIPTDNPFVQRKGALAEIWSYGHRNPQGLFFDPKKSELWEQEHGPRGGDEINKIIKGLNYGWPITTYGREYSGPKIGEGTSKPGMQQPLKYYVPSIAPSGLLIYSGKKFKKWNGSWFSGALAQRHLNRVFSKNGKLQEERLFENKFGRIRNVKEDAEGNIYVSTDSGQLLRLSLKRLKP